MIVQINPRDISYLDAEEFCLKPYPNHPKGCPNYGKKKGCPPNLPKIDELLDFNKNIFVIYTEFPIGEHSERMKKLHPNWSDKQIYCCLYWQPKARKLHKQEINKYKKERDINMILTAPEAYEVNVNLLMNKIGVKLEWPPREKVRIVSLGGTQK